MEYDSAPVDYFDCVVIDAGVVSREYGKPCVASIQGIITTLQRRKLVEVGGTTGIVRLLD
jgi:phosphoenolpyruvate synthase/pyruvate phosphate dikinase